MHHLGGRTLALLLALCPAACALDGADSGEDDLDTAEAALSASYAPPACDANCKSNGTLAAMDAAAKKYGFPRWFVYATVHRESTFNPKAKYGSGTDANCDIGYGLTQITCPHHVGLTYPNDVSSPNQDLPAWQGDMRIKAFCSETGLCPWIDMADVTKLANANERFDPVKNLDRYFSGYAAPAFYLERARAPRVSGESEADFNNRILRRVAWHWRYGHYASFKYPSDPGGYFSGSTPYRWDNYASTYRPAVEAQDGVWDGNVCKPPYSANGCGGGVTPAPAPTPTAPTSGAVATRYDFEGSTQSWQATPTSLVSSIGATTSRSVTGSSSLAVNLVGSTGTRRVYTSSGSLPTAGKTVTLRVYVPSGSKVSWLQAYVQEGASGGWKWTTATKNANQLTPGAWNTVSVTVPAGATSVASIGLQLGVSAAWTGTVNVDTVTW